MPCMRFIGNYEHLVDRALGLDHAGTLVLVPSGWAVALFFDPHYSIKYRFPLIDWEAPCCVVRLLVIGAEGPGFKIELERGIFQKNLLVHLTINRCSVIPNSDL